MAPGVGGTDPPPSPALILSDRRVAWALAALFFAVGLEAVWSGRYLHDEGLLTYYFASFVREEPLAALFFQKARPVTAALYAPVSALGFRAFAIAHVAVCAASLPMIAAVARRLGMPWGNVPALVLGASPLFLICAPAGHTNADAVVAIVLGLWLHVVAGRSALSGAVLAAALLIRSEAVVLVAALAVERALARDVRWWAGAAAVPLAYALAGAAYHHDLLWLIHYPPALLAPVPHARWVPEAGALAERLNATLTSLLCVTPACALALLPRLERARREERALAVGLAIFVLAIRGLPMVGLFNFDESPRYLLVALPALALLVGRHVEAAREARIDVGHATLVLGALAVLATLVAAGGAASLPALGAIAASTLVVALGTPQRAAVAVGAWVALALATFPLWRGHTRLAPPAHELAALGEWWRSTRAGRSEPTPVVTNFELARAWLQHHGLLDEERTPVHFLLQHDMAYELDRLLNANVGQDERIYAAMQLQFYGRPIRAGPGRQVDSWPAGTIVIWLSDDRLGQTLDLPSWDARLRAEVRTDRLVIGVLRP